MQGSDEEFADRIMKAAVISTHRCYVLDSLISKIALLISEFVGSFNVMPGNYKFLLHTKEIYRPYISSNFVARSVVSE